MGTRNSYWLICPYCGYEHSDAWEICTSDLPKEETCGECGKTFKCWAEYDVNYIAEKLPQQPETET